MAASNSGGKKMVKVYVPMVSDQEDPNLFVGINGKSYLVPKGVDVEVPEEVAAEIRRSNEAKERAAKRSKAIRDSQAAANEEQRRIIMS